MIFASALITAGLMPGPSRMLTPCLTKQIAWRPWAGNSVFSAMDLTSGFYNIAMAEEDKKLTAFTTSMGLYEFNRLPQGLCNSPASFMRLMTNIFGDQNFLTLLCYLDDLLVYAQTSVRPSRDSRWCSVGFESTG